MDTAVRVIVSLKKLFYKLNETNLRSEFFDQEQSSIRRKITAVEIYFDFLIAFQ